MLAPGYTVAMRKPVLPILLWCVLATCAHAAGSAASTPDVAAQRDEFKRALVLAESRPLSELGAIRAAFAAHPLAPYLDYAALRRSLPDADFDAIEAFLAAHPDLPVAGALREQALRTLARRQDWGRFRRLYRDSADPGLRCADLLSRRSDPPDAAWLDAATALWLVGRSQPDRCDAVFDTLRRHGRLDASRIQQRIALAADAGNLGLMRFLARSLPADARERALGHADFLENPSATRVAAWPDDEASRHIALLGVDRLARRDATAAEALWAALEPRLGFSAAERGQALNQIALWSAASYLPDSARRFAAVPPEGWDARLHEWQFREALARGDEAAALAAIAAMPSAQRADPRWRYFDARLRQRAGDASARDAFAALASEPNYYGFLAAERLQAPYALCPQEPTDSAALRQTLTARPGFQRALELHALGHLGWARMEWAALRPALSPEERRLAVALAEAAGWHDRGPFSLGADADLTYYRLRFPLPYARRIRQETQRHGLDLAWVLALIRAESAWAPDARSHANARGLMQLLPATARTEAQRRALRYPGDAALFRPVANLRLGIAHLATMLEQHEGRAFLATAAYNAGPGAVARWLAQRPIGEVDLWIETIPYRETREYVARILAFAAIYDWRLEGSAVPIAERALGRRVPDAQRRPFACPVATAAVSS